jgi:hypothetical protein
MQWADRVCPNLQLLFFVRFCDISVRERTDQCVIQYPGMVDDIGSIIARRYDNGVDLWSTEDKRNWELLLA